MARQLSLLGGFELRCAGRDLAVDVQELTGLAQGLEFPAVRAGDDHLDPSVLASLLT